MEGHSATVQVRRSALLGVGLAVLLGCAGLASTTPNLSQPPSEAVRAEAAPWLAAEQLPRLDCEEHGSTYAWLALEAPPPVAAQALDGLEGCPDAPDREALAAFRLADPDPAVAGAALRLADVLLVDRVPTADDPVVAGVIASTRHADKAVRYEAVEVYDTVAWTSSPELEAAMLDAVADPSPPVVAEVLERAYDRAAGLQRVDPWAMTARYALVAHLDPGIRGRGALLLARLQPTSATTRRLLRAALDDPHPHVRAIAAQALAEAGDRAAVHLLVERLKDEDVVQVGANWKMLPWEGSDGRRRQQLFEGSYFERVDDAMVRAAASLTEGMDEPYVLRDINLRYLDLDLVGCVRDLSAWYEAHADELAALDE